MLSLASLVEDALHLFYPHFCKSCGYDNLKKDQLLCFHCLNSLPRTDFAKHPNNLTERIFAGRLDIAAAHSEFYFSKGKIIQHLLHQLKYKGKKEIGVFLGGLLGESILKSGRFLNIDVIIPLPMFIDKEKKRGYNQSVIIANGISSILKVPVLENIVFRNRFTETQTRKQRSERWLNVEGSFDIKNEKLLEGKNILLVDDIITTGSTLESCGRKILKIPSTNLNMATLAVATK